MCRKHNSCRQAIHAPQGAIHCRDSKHAVSTWLDCSRLMSDFRGRSREFIKAYFCHKTHRFLPLSVLGNRSKDLFLPIICKPTVLPTASRLRSEGTSLKSHRLNSLISKTVHSMSTFISNVRFCLFCRKSQSTVPTNIDLERLLCNPFSGFKINEFLQLNVRMIIFTVLTGKRLRIMFE